MNETHTRSETATMDMTSKIIAAYVRQNHVQAAELPALIGTIHQTLNDLANPAQVTVESVKKPTTAEIKRSITPDHIVSFENGGQYKTLGRHLNALGLSADAYRAKWGLPSDYPMVAASYSAKRSELALSIGLGQIRKDAAGEQAQEMDQAA